METNPHLKFILNLIEEYRNKALWYHSEGSIVLPLINGKMNPGSNSKDLFLVNGIYERLHLKEQRISFDARSDKILNNHLKLVVYFAYEIQNCPIARVISSPHVPDFLKKKILFNIDLFE